MLFKRAFKVALVFVAAGLAVVIVSAQDDSETQAKIENAMSAAPEVIASDASILDRVRDADGKFVILREGTNGWSCLPDSPRTATNDPICVDEVFMGWIYARIAREAPVVTTISIAYLLQGGETNSNDDPFAAEPADDFYATTAPLMMILLPPEVDLSGFQADERAGEPFIMYGDTPYEHLMLVLGDSPHESDQSDSETRAKIENAMSAAPLSIAENATIMDHEFDAEGSIVILREGTNSWTCFPDLPGTPGNDPACYDETWMQWLKAYLAGEEPNITTPGLSYMLQGSSDASNTDPFAMEPAAGEEWIASPPHIMLILPGRLDTSLFSTDPESGQPWIMFAGTPYEHLMMPVAEAGRDQ